MDNKDNPLNMPDENDNHVHDNDPTYNVLQLVKAAVQRQDDLRNAENRRIQEVSALHADYSQKLREAESKRIDAIRAVDVAAVATANEKATQQALVLANQVTQSADNLRTLVSTTAAALAQQLATYSTQTTDRLAALERSQYENRGKGAGAQQFVGWIIAAIAIIGFIVSHFGLK